MSLYRKAIVSSILGLVVVVSGCLVWLGPVLFNAHKPAQAAGASRPQLPYNATTNGPYTVSGNKILGADGKQYIFHGIARDGLEFNCSGSSTLDQQHLAYMGSGTNTATETYWGANTVRLPLSEGFWLNGAPGYPCTAAQYQATVKQTVDILTALKLNVIIDLQWTDGGGQSGQGGGPWAMPDADSVTFWQQVAPIYKSYSNVLFELYNEPHPGRNNWPCWAAACNITNDAVRSDDCSCTKTLSYHSVGMQALVDTVRKTGAQNLVLVAGIGWGFDLSQVGGTDGVITGANVVYDTHPYPYSDKLANSWDAAFGNTSAKYPVISAENGEYDCGSSYLSQLYDYLDAHGIGWVAWAWVHFTDTSTTCSYPLLVTDSMGTPSANTGQFVYQRLRSYQPVLGPTSKVWYFAEGHVGAGFNERLALYNPDPSTDCSVTLQYLLGGLNPVYKTITVPHGSRFTESVNDDLGAPVTQAKGMDVATIVSVNAGACTGIVAERPMTFSWRGTTSGGTVLGANALAASFYFGDIPTGAGNSSFITILNPPNNPAATVTATYYVGGKAVGTAQSVTVQPGMRSTIGPNSAGLPPHVAAVVTSTAPVVVERPYYFYNIDGGNAGTVAGATTVVGAKDLANDWLLAEGYTGSGFQENLIIANLDTTANAAATVTVNLRFLDGTTKAFPVTVNPLDQVIWNVNQYAPGSSVSAEVTSQGANIVVEREMFFHYNRSTNIPVAATGGTDVVGKIGPGNTTMYNFAEGYNGTGYNEWLTLQNPTNADEVIYLNLVNAHGLLYQAAPITVTAHSRYNVDITSLVLQNMISAGADRGSYEVAMTVYTPSGAPFIAERPLYWNADGTQGGSDVIGFA